MLMATVFWSPASDWCSGRPFRSTATRPSQQALIMCRWCANIAHPDGHAQSSWLAWPPAEFSLSCAMPACLCDLRTL